MTLFPHFLQNAYIGEYREWKPDASRTLLYLPLESNATDQSGNSRSTSPSNITYANLGGVMCANANGSSSKIQITNTSFLPSNATEGTISFLVYGTSSSATKFIEFASSNCFIQGYYRNSGGNYLQCNGWSGPYPISNSEVTLNAWHLFTITLGADGGGFYFDGILKNTISRGTTTSFRGNTPDTTGFYVFCNRNGNNNRWNGGGRELIIENKKRSVEDVTKYYQRIKSKLGF